MSGIFLYDANRWLKQAEIAAAMSLEALKANMKPYTPKLHQARGFPGAIRSAYAVYCNNSGGTAQPIRSKPSNVWGLYDMAGNVEEYAWDHYDPGYYAVSPAEDPLGPESMVPGRAVRGGAYDDPSAALTAYIRATKSASGRAAIRGARFVRSVTNSCVPSCEGMECGGDGCGGSCGTCGAGETCHKGSCMPAGMVWVAPGSFSMGCRPGDMNCEADESPYHDVTLSGFGIDQTEVPMAAYASCVSDDACAAPAGACGPSSGMEPANCIPWSQAQAFCSWNGKRLCTEAEWEKAARGSDGRLYPWGDSPVWTDSNYMCDNFAVAYACVGGIRTVGSRDLGASPCGAEDMLGNVWEWTADWYGATYYSISPESAPFGPSDGTQRVMRGNAYTHIFVPGGGVLNMRISRRLGWNPEDVHPGIGIRCCWGP